MRKRRASLSRRELLSYAGLWAGPDSWPNIFPALSESISSPQAPSDMAYQRGQRTRLRRLRRPVSLRELPAVAGKAICLITVPHPKLFDGETSTSISLYQCLVRSVIFNSRGPTSAKSSSGQDDSRQQTTLLVFARHLLLISVLRSTKNCSKTGQQNLKCPLIQGSCLEV